MVDFMNGLNVMACGVITLFFLRFWRQTGERLFAGFAAGFALLACSWIALAVTDPVHEFRPLLYSIRLLAFGLIIAAIVDKNRSKKP
jgi:hypothetical protein